MAFGSVAIDHVGPVRDFPSASMLTGLIGNALGWHWSDGTLLQSLQDRLIFATWWKQDGSLLTDTQNVQLAKNDKGWTTLGTPEGRYGASYGSPHRRLRDYHSDLSVGIVLRLEATDDALKLDDLSNAIDKPVRPLFFGRKSCLPSAPILKASNARWVAGETAFEAICAVLGNSEAHHVLWPVGEGPETGDNVDRIIDLEDVRNWISGLHCGSRRMVVGRVIPISVG